MASTNISFDQIPASIRKPGKYFEFNTTNAVRTLAANSQIMLIIAQKAEDSDAPLVPVQIYDDATAGALFGYGSQAQLMVQAAIRAYQYLDLSVLPVPPESSRLSRTEQEVALKNGVTPLEVGPGEVVQIVRAISTYTRNAAGATDISLLDMTTIRTLDYVARTVKERIDLRYPREKLSTRTPPKVRSEVLDVLRQLEQLEIVEEVEANAAGVICERDLQDPNRLDCRIPSDVVNGLHVFAGVIDLRL